MLISSSTRCVCDCHTGGFGDRMRADGVDVSDVVEAAVACTVCRANHCAALISRQLPNDPEPPPVHIELVVQWHDDSEGGE